MKKSALSLLYELFFLNLVMIESVFIEFISLYSAAGI